jgi:hypothetical protein
MREVRPPATRSPFTLFQAHRINFAIVVYSVLAACRGRLALNQLWDHGGQHGQESEEGKEEDRQEEKEVAFAN